MANLVPPPQTCFTFWKQEAQLQDKTQFNFHLWSAQIVLALGPFFPSPSPHCAELGHPRSSKQPPALALLKTTTCKLFLLDLFISSGGIPNREVASHYLLYLQFSLKPSNSEPSIYLFAPAIHSSETRTTQFVPAFIPACPSPPKNLHDPYGQRPLKLQVLGESAPTCLT